MSYRLANFWLRNDVLFSLFGGKWKQTIDNCLRVLHNFSNSIILKRRDELVKNLNASEPELPDGCDEGGGKRMALLDILLQSTIDGQPLTNEDIREEVDTFMFEVCYCRRIVNGISTEQATNNSHKNNFDCLGARHGHQWHCIHAVFDLTPQECPGQTVR